MDNFIYPFHYKYIHYVLPLTIMIMCPTGPIIILYYIILDISILNIRQVLYIGINLLKEVLKCNISPMIKGYVYLYLIIKSLRYELTFKYILKK